MNLIVKVCKFEQRNLKLLFMLFVSFLLFTNISFSEVHKELTKMSLEELMELEVTTGTKTSVKLEEIPASMTIVSASDIKNYGYQTLADVLQAQAGFFVFSDRIYNFVINRGFYQSNDPNSRILLLVDGHSVVEFFGYYNGHLPIVDLNHVERIEILRGPGSAIYGTNAMFAVINVITKDLEDIDEGKLILETGSFQHNKISFGIGKTINDFSFYFQSTFSNGDKQVLFFKEYDFENHPGGAYSKGSANEETLYNSSLKIKYKNITFSGMLNSREKHVPTGLYGGAFNNDKTFFKDINSFMELKADFNFIKNTKTTLRIYTDTYEFNGRYMYNKDESWELGPPYESEFNKITNNDLGIELLFDTKWNDNHKTTFGFEYKDYSDLLFQYYSENDIDENLNEFYDINPKENISSAYFSHIYQPTEKWILNIGAHYDNYSSIGSKTSMRSSISYKYQDQSWIKLIYGQAFRAPNMWELNGGFFLTGNKDLKPETSDTLEISINTKFNEKTNWKNSIYKYSLKNNIQATNGINFQNIEGVEGKGIESELNYLSDNLNSYLSITLSNVEKEATSSQIPYSPKWMAKGGLNYTFEESGINFSIETQLIGSRKKGIESEGNVPSFILTNLSLTNIKFLNNFSFLLKAYNVFNTKYEHPSFIGDLATWNLNSIYPVYDIPANGRSFILKVSYSF